ncbi:SDR family oxidoreductase [Rhizorhabdus wittichii]|uniref:SDR family oxidoreductase n=1 Tax=Rhizorhabdus wittichii TaxID=160791 RepID=A0A975D1I2_9SPHN|nr:SDR family oxidoreductase [Rhizorhabdus wittichii]QTH21081.1 SDR family oxidoreductase [Rhizorhabdus wittichii]
MTDRLFPDGAVLLFGGSGGLGGAIALEFARAGSAVALGYRGNREKAEAMAAEIAAVGVEASTVQADLTDRASVEAAIAATIERHSRVHSIVFAAGPLVPQVYMSQVTPEQWKAAFAIEADGFFNVVQAALPHFRAAGGGSFVHLGSAGDRLWPGKDGLSVVPKAANEALIRGIAREEGRFGIRANSVLVGVIAGGMFDKLDAIGHFDEAWKDATRKSLSIKRYGKPAEIGHAAVFLASEKAAYITGEQISVSGGFGV